MKGKNKKILIIGGCGYIGSELYLHLKKNNFVTTVDLEWFGNYINPENIKIDYDKLSKSFLSSYDVIILLAGHSNFYMCNNNNFECFKNNVYKFIRLLNKLSGQTFIYASSSGVYENTKTIDIKEDSAIFIPSSYYDLTKREIDYYAELSSSNYIGLRLGTLSGYSSNFRVDLMINRMYHHAKQFGKIIIHNPDLFRPVLGIEDFYNAVDTVINSKVYKGIYNLASFNSKIKDIAVSVAAIIGNIEIKVDDDFIHYDNSFTMNTEKFRKTYNFIFKENVESIVKSMIIKYPKVIKSDRKTL